MLNTVRFSFNRVVPKDTGDYPEIDPKLLSVPGQPPPGLSPGSSITAWEGSPKPVDFFITNRFNYQDDVNWTLGAHSLQLGGMLERYQINLSGPNRPYGAWSFSNLRNFLQAIPNRLRGTPPRRRWSGFRRSRPTWERSASCARSSRASPRAAP